LARLIFALTIQLAFAAPIATQGDPKICSVLLSKFNDGRAQIRQWLWDVLNPGQIAPWILLKDSQEKSAEFENIKTSFTATDDSISKVRFALQEVRKVGGQLYFLERRSGTSEFQFAQSILLRKQLLMYCYYLIDVHIRSSINVINFEVPVADRTEAENVGKDYCAENGFWLPF
jgi:hypothetical protein